MDLLNCLSMQRESRVYVIQIIYPHKHNSPLRKTNYQESIQLTVVYLIHCSYEIVIGACWLLVLVQVREDLTVVLWWLCVTSADTSDCLVHAFSLVIFDTLAFFELLKSASLLVTFVDTDFSAFRIGAVSLHVTFFGTFCIRVVSLYASFATFFAVRILASQEQEHSLDSCAIENLGNFCWCRWRINSGYDILIKRI